ncbi:MAG: hypothetical protein C0592_05045, partial [Marinilabiliales bacterium]
MRLLLFITAVLAIAGLSAQSVEPDSSMLKKHVEYFASQELNGRLPGTVGYELAVQYSMDYLENLGVKPFTPDYWPQRFPIDVNIINDANMYIGDPGHEEELKLGTDFSVRGYSGSGTVVSEVVFCGYGFDNGVYSDYQDVDVAGKIVMVFKGSPAFIEGGPRLSIREKADIAYNKGAKAIIFVSEPNGGRPQYQPIGSVMHGDGPMHQDMPQVQVSIDIANTLIKIKELTLSEIQTKIDSSKAPQSFNTKSIATIKVFADYKEDGHSMNLVGV